MWGSFSMCALFIACTFATIAKFEPLLSNNLKCAPDIEL